MESLLQITTCSDLASCFQAVYNLGLVILFSLAFLNMVYGAIEYLFSAGSITSKESGKNRIMNSIGAIIVVLVLPQILNIINPRIFQVKLKIPYLEKAKPPVFTEYGGYAGILPYDPNLPQNYGGRVILGRGYKDSYCRPGETFVPVMKQIDNDFYNIPFGDGFVGPSGCALVSLAMAKLWHDKRDICNDGKISKEEKEDFKRLLTDLINDFRGYIGDEGTYLTAFNRNDILRKYDLESQFLEYKDIVRDGTVNSSIFHVGPIIYLVRNHLGYVGHYMIIVGYDPNKGFIINDPSGRDINYVSPESLNCAGCRFVLIKKTY